MHPEQQCDEELSHQQRSPRFKQIAQSLSKTPLWLYIIGGIMLVILACGMLMGSVLIVLGLSSSSFNSEYYIEGGPGESAHLNNGGSHLFTFPESAANIESDCSIWQETLIQVWFEMDAGELEPFLDSMRWDVRPLIPTTDPPPFGEPHPDASYLHGKYIESAKSLNVGVWVDTSSVPYRTFVRILFY